MEGNWLTPNYEDKGEKKGSYVRTAKLDAVLNTGLAFVIQILLLLLIFYFPHENTKSLQTAVE